MKARTALWMTLTTFLIVFILAFINGVNSLNVAPHRFISPNNVRGMAVEYQGVLYTLNFDQQNEWIELFNIAIPTTPDDVELLKPPISKVIIYRFNAPDMQIDLLGLSKNVHQPQILTFKNPDWFSDILSTKIPNNYSEIFTNTYDPISP